MQACPLDCRRRTNAHRPATARPGSGYRWIVSAPRSVQRRRRRRRRWARRWRCVGAPRRHEIVGEGLTTGYRDVIAADIMRPGYAASGVTATSLEITRRWRLSHRRRNRLPIHHTVAIQDRAHGAPRRIDASWAPRPLIYVNVSRGRRVHISYGTGGEKWTSERTQGAREPQVENAGDGLRSFRAHILREPVGYGSRHSTRGPASRTEVRRQWRKAGWVFFEFNAAGAPPDAGAVMHGTLVRGRS